MKKPLLNTSFLLFACLLLTACGQTGALYMPETFSKQPPPEQHNEAISTEDLLKQHPNQAHP